MIVRAVTRYKYPLLLFVLFVFHGINNYVWLTRDAMPPLHDMGFHLVAALDCQKMLESPSLGALASLWDYAVIDFYPPLFNVCMAVSNMVLGISPMSSAMTNLFFLAVLLVSCYYTGRKMGDAGIGVLGAFLVTMYPYVFGTMRLPLQDFALLAVVSASFCFLWYTDHFSRTSMSLLFAASMVAGMLIKQVYVLFIAGPLLVVLGRMAFCADARSRKAVINAAVSLLLSAVAVALWYLPKMDILLLRYMNAAYAEAASRGMPPVFSAGSFLYNLWNLAANQVCVFFFVLFLAALAVYWFKEKNIGAKLLLVSAVVVPYAIFVLIRTKETKTTVPYLVFIALITAAGTLKIANRNVRGAVIALSVIVGIVQYYDVGFGDGALIKHCLGGYARNKLLAPITCTSRFSPSREDWKMKELVSAMAAAVPGNVPRHAVVIGAGAADGDPDAGDDRCSRITASYWPVSYYWYSLNYPQKGRVVRVPWSRYRKAILVLPYPIARMPYDQDQKREYRLRERFVLPDRSAVYLYEKIVRGGPRPPVRRAADAWNTVGERRSLRQERIW